MDPSSSTLSTGKESIGPLHEFMGKKPDKGSKRVNVESREGLIVEDRHG